MTGKGQVAAPRLRVVRVLAAAPGFLAGDAAGTASRHYGWLRPAVRRALGRALTWSDTGLGGRGSLTKRSPVRDHESDRQPGQARPVGRTQAGLA